MTDEEKRAAYLKSVKDEAWKKRNLRKAKLALTAYFKSLVEDETCEVETNYFRADPSRLRFDISGIRLLRGTYSVSLNGVEMSVDMRNEAEPFVEWSHCDGEMVKDFIAVAWDTLLSLSAGEPGEFKGHVRTVDCPDDHGCDWEQM